LKGEGGASLPCEYVHETVLGTEPTGRLGGERTAARDGRGRAGALFRVWGPQKAGRETKQSV
jgi:hypothetical protein